MENNVYFTCDKMYIEQIKNQIDKLVFLGNNKYFFTFTNEETEFIELLTNSRKFKKYLKGSKI